MEDANNNESNRPAITFDRERIPLAMIIVEEETEVVRVYETWSKSIALPKCKDQNMFRKYVKNCTYPCHLTISCVKVKKVWYAN